MRFLLFCLFLSAVACDSPGHQLQRLQRDFLEQFPRPRTLLIVAEKDTLALPYPPGEQNLSAGKIATTQWLERANALDASALQPADQTRLATFKTLLDSLSQPDKTALTDPRLYCVMQLLTQLSTKSGPPPTLLLALLDSLPAYYSSVEQDWVPANRNHTAEAIDCSLRALDQLDQLTATSAVSPERLYHARLAIKNFIARCQSEVLE